MKPFNRIEAKNEDGVYQQYPMDKWVCQMLLQEGWMLQVTSQNSTVICFEAFWFGLKRKLNKQRVRLWTKDIGEDLNRNIKKAPRTKTRKWSSEPKDLRKRTSKVAGGNKMKWDYLIKASNPLNGKQWTLLTSTPFSKCQLSRSNGPDREPSPSILEVTSPLQELGSLREWML